jgi:glycosyl transferase family 25
MTPIFLINLDSSKDRLAFMQAQANALGLSFERIPAVEGRNVPSWLKAEFVDSSRMSDGAVGCYASHLIAAQIIVSRQLPCAVILEDDAKLATNFADVIKGAVGCAPPDWDYLHISSRFKKSVIRITDIDETHKLIRYVLPPSGTVGYVLSNSGARKWLAPMPRIRPNDLDNRFAWQQRLKIYGVYPAIVTHDWEMPSTLGRAKKRPKWEPPLLEQLRGNIWTLGEVGLRNYLMAKVVDVANSLRKRLGRPSQIEIIDP